MRPILPVLLGLLMLAPFAARALTTERKTSSPALELPQLRVPANVPLQKVAELRMLEPRFAPAAVAHGNFIYIIGGSGRDDAPLASIERFDIRTGRSEPFAQLRTPRLWHRAVLVGEKIYVIGGDSLSASAAPPYLRVSPAFPAGQPSTADQIGLARRAREVTEGGSHRPGFAQLSAHPGDVRWEPHPLRGRNPLSSVEIIDLPTGTVTPGPEMPRTRTGFGCVALGSRIYVLGGGSRSSAGPLASNRLLILDTITSQWIEGKPMPHVRAEAAAAAVTGDFIIVPGGYRSRSMLAAVDVLDTHNGTWSEIAPLVRPCSSHSLAFVGHHLFLFGDYENPGELIAYDLTTKTSEVLTLQYKAARHTAAVVTNDQIFVIGGRTDRRLPPTDLIQVFAPVRS